MREKETEKGGDKRGESRGEEMGRKEKAFSMVLHTSGLCFPFYFCIYISSP